MLTNNFDEIGLKRDVKCCLGQLPGRIINCLGPRHAISESSDEFTAENKE